MKILTKIIIVSFFFTFSIVQVFSTINAQETKFCYQAWSTGSIEGLNYNSSTLGRQQLPQNITTDFRQSVEEKITETPPEKKVSVVMPANNTIATKSIKGYFPIHPYVFFDEGNKEIPLRYIMLSKAAAQDFKESDLGNFIVGDLTVKETNINQVMIAYYDVINVYADRMRKNPNELLTLRGSDPVEKDGETYANNVKSYLVNNFGIDAKRIKTIVEPPRKPSGSISTDSTFIALLDDENRRVVFIFSNQDMLRPISYTIRDESLMDNDMVFSISKDVKFKSWDISITGENNTMNFGPFKNNKQRINPAPLMRGLAEGKFNAKVVISMQDGKQVTEDIDFKLLKERELRNASRYLMIFDYNKSESVLSYETKIRKEITPGLNVGNTVIIHGHTDIIGNEEENQKLSQERADQVKGIIEDELSKENKKVNVQAIGIGQTNMQYTFSNRYPEGRMYNRNVFVEIIK
ncbi:MAG: OmpA family protein [Ignavibacteriales bacterium]|nr:OmpA family protein [Ignavibacteriales bacterium]